MKSKTFLFVLLISGLLISGVYGSDKEDITKVIEEGYFNGAFNKLDTKSMAKAFHPDFAIFWAEGEKLGKYPIDTWIKGIEKKKATPDFKLSAAKSECKIINIDVTGGCASVKVEISKGEKLIYTDYLSLLKFKDGWRIVAKVYHKHK